MSLLDAFAELMMIMSRDAVDGGGDVVVTLPPRAFEFVRTQAERRYSHNPTLDARPIVISFGTMSTLCIQRAPEPTQ